jgi:hypothetical protein
MRWDSDLATVVLGLNDNVPNELGFKNFWLVKNQTGATITKGSIVYANGTVGASGRITIDKFIADGSIDAKYLLGITAHDLSQMVKMGTLFHLVKYEKLILIPLRLVQSFTLRQRRQVFGQTLNPLRLTLICLSAFVLIAMQTMEQ